jgi:DNA replicative helicase MCM subunit Mcm2 (Cdc46/Mcm family)
MPCHQRANPPKTPEITADDIRRWEQIASIVRRVKEGCSEAEFAALRCPKCGAALALHVHPNLHTFAVFCTTSTLHMMKHESTAEAPTWWHNRITSDWLGYR